MRPKTKKILFSFSILVFLFFYIPIVILMIYSFNDSRLGTIWTGFTFDWYPQLFANKQIMAALKNSLYVAVITMLLSSVIGTLVALALHRYNFIGKRIFKFLIYVPIVIPDIVLGVAMLALYGWINVTLNLQTVIPGHVTMATSYVVLVLLARLAGFDNSLEEAAKDLGANGWKTFWHVTFPLISPGLIAGALMAFTVSLDEFVVSYFTAGPGSDTLPVHVYSMIRTGVTPEINVLSTLLILFITAIVLIVGKGMIGKKRKQGE